jgi:hypothetical protein
MLMQKGKRKRCETPLGCMPSISHSRASDYTWWRFLHVLWLAGGLQRRQAVIIAGGAGTSHRPQISISSPGNRFSSLRLLSTAGKVSV